MIFFYRFVQLFRLDQTHFFTETQISSVERQKGTINIQRYSIENQKGTITVQSL